MTDTRHPQEPVKPARSPGMLLRTAREASGQTHAAVGEALHLTVHYIKALESDEYAKLPGLTFVKGYIRAYARYLKLDVDAVLECYDAHVKVMPAIKSYTLAGNYTRKRNDQAIGWAVAATLIIVIGLGAGWWFVGREEAPVASMPSAASLANQTAQRSSPPAASAPAQIVQTMPGPTVSSAATGVSTNQTAVGPGAVLAGPSTALGVATLPGEAAAGEPPVNAVVSPTLPTADVVSAATAILPVNQANGSEALLVSSPPEPTVQADVATPPMSAVTTTTGDAAAPAITTTPMGGRQVTLVRQGSDRLQLTFTGDSWVEIDDGLDSRLYNEMLRAGDVLNVQGSAPFKVLFGNGHNVQVNFNASAVDIAPSIRDDNTARVTLANAAAGAAALEPAAGTPVTVEAPVTSGVTP